MKQTTRRKFVAAAAVTGAASLAGCKKETNSTNSDCSGSASFKWKMVTTWPKNFPGLGTGANNLAKYIEEMSNGRISVKVFGAGELVPALGVFDAVSRGTAEMGHGASYYWQGKHPATPFFGAVPFGLNAYEMNGWLYYGGGLELWQELYKPFGIKPFPAGNTGVQMGGWFNKEIKTPKDFDGLKIRMPGLGGKVLSKLGAAVVTLSGGEIFQSLKTGTIDASEWVGPYNDLATGMHKAAKYYYTPGWHEPGTTLEGIVNQKAFNSLPKDLQKIVELACKAANQDMIAEFNARNAQALQTLMNEHKVIIREFNFEVLSKLSSISDEILEGISKKDALSKKIYESFKTYRSNAKTWDKVAEYLYSSARV